MASTVEKSKVLLIGATGYIGKFIAEASVRSGHRTFALVRDTAPSDASKSQVVQKLKDSGVTLIQVSFFSSLFLNFFSVILKTGEVSYTSP
jgi:nucleoside-diphosphate-sugar epimerase